MQVALDWKQGLGFTGKNADGLTVEIDADPDIGGSGAEFTAMQLLALGLGGCTGMDVISILKKKRQEVTAFQVRVHTQRTEEHPRVWTKILIEYILTGKDIDPAAVERAIQLSSEKYCPAQNMFKKAVSIESKYEIQQSAA